MPLLVHEQNAVLGRANRMIAKRATGLALTFAETEHAEMMAEDRHVPHRQSRCARRSVSIWARLIACRLKASRWRCW